MQLKRKKADTMTRNYLIYKDFRHCFSFEIYKRKNFNPFCEKQSLLKRNH